jgi:hypothetical protein
MDVVITFRSGTKFAWKNVKASEVEAVAVDIKELAEKDQEARKAAKLFKKQAELNGKKGEKNGHSRRLQPRSRPKGRSKS